MAAVAMLGSGTEVVPCEVSADVFRAVGAGDVDGAVLPIENSLHGSVAEHYDLLMENDVRLDRESLLRIHHNVIAAPGVELAEIKTILSHPVALSQCRKFLSSLKNTRAQSFYDTAGSVKHVMEAGLRDTAALAPALSAEVYGAEILVPHVEDHEANYTRFHLVRRAIDPRDDDGAVADKMTVGFVVEHRPGTLVRALQRMSEAGVDLTRIESRPVHGKPWEYVFYVEFRFAGGPGDKALEALREECSVVKEIGRYRESSKL